jgi:hypothetical protein
MEHMVLLQRLLVWQQQQQQQGQVQTLPAATWTCGRS